MMITGVLTFAGPVPFVSLLELLQTRLVDRYPRFAKRVEVSGVGLGAFWVPQSGKLALGVSIFSYAGEVVVGVATDASVVQDPADLVRRFVGQLDAVVA